MSKHVDGLLDDYYYQRWNVTHAPSAGTTCVASIAAANSSKSRQNLEAIIFSARNVTAASVTLTLSVRDASIAGTVLASWDMIVATGTCVQDCFSQYYVQGLRGNGLVAEFGTPVASVTQKVSICGWTEQTTNG